MSATVKRTSVALAVLALACLVLGPLLLAPLEDERLADLLGTGVFVVMVGATAGATAAVWWAGRRDAAVRRGATASAVCCVAVLVAIGLVYLSAAPAAVQLLALVLLFVALVAHVVVTVVLPVAR